MTKKKIAPPACGDCGCIARLTNGREIYPNRDDLWDKSMYRCDDCGAYVGCHPGSDRPLGTPAGRELRRARELLHDRIDPIWRGAPDCGEYAPESPAARTLIMRAARSRVYHYLAAEIGIPGKDFHVAMFDLERCRAVWRASVGLTYPTVRRWHQARKEAEATTGEDQ